MGKQVNSCYFQIRDIAVIRKYTNDEISQTLAQTLIISHLDYDNARLYSALWDTANSECRTVLNVLGKTQSQKVKYNISFIPASLIICTFRITVEDPVLYIQNTEWSRTTSSKRSDMKVHPSKTATNWALFDFRVPKGHIAMHGRGDFPNISFQALE